tara:strand:- start:604 stop:1560 length:957 start_codon:yes stop_codon:yes gene_type:complete
MKTVQIIIPKRMHGQRLDSVIAEMLPNYSRSKITSLIKSGDALIRENRFKPKDKSDGNEIVTLNLRQQEKTHWIPQKICIDIIFEDNDIIVINKPFGLVTHPGAGNWTGTLANALLEHNPQLSKLDRAGLVHRLDKNTSGLMVVAKNHKAQKFLVEQLQSHLVEREYSAIVYGSMISGGTVNEPIGRNHRDRIKQSVTSKGKNAVTHYRVIDRFVNHTHIKAILETGRTHQIRVHFSHIGHPLIGDPIYGGKVKFPKKASDELKDALKSFKRQALHSKKLTLTHPNTGKSMTWKIELPEDMKKLIAVLNTADSITDIN